jgi:hypothetical protein
MFGKNPRWVNLLANVLINEAPFQWFSLRRNAFRNGVQVWLAALSI